MGIDAGFDISPPLDKGGVDQQNWGKFIDLVKEHYEGDPQVEIKPNYIIFNAGEHPKLPFEGHKCLRFSSKVSGAIAKASGVERYIKYVTELAKLHIGSRIQYWNEADDQRGTYDWDTVYQSIRSYKQPDPIETSISVTPSTNDTESLNKSGMPLFEIEDIPGKGKGLVARVNITSGTRILCKKPFLTVHSKPCEELEQTIAAKLKTMSKTSQRQFLALHNNFPGKYPFSGIAKTNALPCGSGARVGGLYPTACFINHSCVPNAHNNWNSEEEHETIHAIKFIEKGTEITIPYDHGGPSIMRQATLKEAFGFTCTCSTCTMPASMLEASDNRRIKILELDEAIGDPYRMMDRPHEVLQDCYSLLQVLEQEFDGCAKASIARLCYDAFQVTIAHGDQARARMFAERAYEARVICEGEDSPTTQKAKKLAANPSDHLSFEMYSRKWRTKRNLVPKGLDTEQFSKWLFRQGS